METVIKKLAAETTLYPQQPLEGKCVDAAEMLTGENYSFFLKMKDK